MYKLEQEIAAYTLAQALGLDVVGENKKIASVTSVDRARYGCLSFSNTPTEVSGTCIQPSASNRLTTSQILSSAPRYDFVRALHHLIKVGLLSAEVSNPRSQPGFDPSNFVSQAVELQNSVRLGHHLTLGKDGFGFERGPDGVPLRFPHLGRLIIEDGVEIGDFCKIDRGTLSDTKIGKNVKIDAQAYIAHNVSIGENTMVMSGARLNGRVKVGNGCWIGTGALIREGSTIGDNTTVGMGAVVLGSFGSNMTLAGNPARPINQPDL